MRHRGWDLALTVMWAPAGAVGALWCWAGGQWPPVAVLVEIGVAVGVLTAALALWLGVRGDADGAQSLARAALRRFLCWLAAAAGYAAVYWAVMR